MEWLFVVGLHQTLPGKQEVRLAEEQAATVYCANLSLPASFVFINVAVIPKC